MATQYQNLSSYDPNSMPKAEFTANQKYAIVVAEWNPAITMALLEGAVNTFTKNGVKKENIEIVYVPGTFELTFGAAKLMEKRSENTQRCFFDAIITLGCVIQGDTPHFDYVCSGVTQGITILNTKENGCPVIFGVLTTNTLQQAEDRAGGIHGNKGDEAAITAIKMANNIW